MSCSNPNPIEGSFDLACAGSIFPGPSAKRTSREKWFLFAGFRNYVVPFGINRASRKSFAMFWKISLIAVTELPGDSHVLLDPLWL
jgi:hypothetical protein